MRRSNILRGVLYLRINTTPQYKLQPSYVVLTEYAVACCRKAINVCCEKKINKISFFLSFYIGQHNGWPQFDLEWGKDCEYGIHSVLKGREDAERTLGSQSLTRTVNKRRHWGIHQCNFVCHSVYYNAFRGMPNCNAGRRGHQLLQHQHDIEASIL
jgi:hypothetical protein